MYGLIWRVLPGPWVSKLVMALGLVVGAGLLLWFFAFPAISPHMPFNDGAVETGGAGTGSGAGGGGTAEDGAAEAEGTGGASEGQ